MNGVVSPFELVDATKVVALNSSILLDKISLAHSTNASLPWFGISSSFQDLKSLKLLALTASKMHIHEIISVKIAVLNLKFIWIIKYQCWIKNPEASLYFCFHSEFWAIQMPHWQKPPIRTKLLNHTPRIKEKTLCDAARNSAATHTNDRKVLL